MNIRKFLLTVCMVGALIFIRSIFLLRMPLYLDEGIYLSWSKLFLYDISFAYISLLDGKTPLFYWLTAVLTHWFSSSFFSARFLSVLGGGLTAFAWIVLTEKTLGRKYSILFWSLLMILPFSFFVERMGFVDSLMTGFGSLALLCIFSAKDSMEKENSLWKTIAFSFLTGLLLSLAYMTKTAAIVFLVSQSLIVLIWTGGFILRKNWRKAIVMLLSFLFMLGVYREMIGYLRVGGYRFWTGIASKEHALTYSLKEIAANLTSVPGLLFYAEHLVTVFLYFLVYTGGVLIFFFLGAFLLIKERKHLWVIFYFSIIFLGVLLSGKVIASRYFYPVIPAFIFIASYGIMWVWERRKKPLRIIVIVCYLMLFSLSSWLVISPLSFPYASHEQAFFSSDLSAVGLDLVITTIGNNNRNTIIGVVGEWGVADGAIVILEERGIKAVQIKVEKINVENNYCPSLFVKLSNACFKINLDQLLRAKEKYKFLYVSKQYPVTMLLEDTKEVVLIKSYPRPRSNKRTYLYQINVAR